MSRGRIYIFRSSANIADGSPTIGSELKKGSPYLVPMHCPKYRQVTSTASGKGIKFADERALIWLLYARIAFILLSLQLHSGPVLSLSKEQALSKVEGPPLCHCKEADSRRGNLHFATLTTDER